MPQLPDGDPAPESGELPAASLARAREETFSIYLHVPYCRVRCGYCDFNTYTLTELGEGASMASYVDQALRELDLANAILGADVPPVSTIFIGGGTPTMLPASDLVRLVGGIRDRFGVEADAEVSTEANPDTVSPAYLEELAAGGFTRASLGMQSSVPHVLATLERTHNPRAVAGAVAAARSAGLESSLDLIYGTPGESLKDWRASLDEAISLEPGHLSAYALIVEEGTKLASQVRRGKVAMPDDDDAADKYELADELLSAAGYQWYEVSNWAKTPQQQCRHNLAYWRGGTWWGVGPGAHSHVGGVRWWNVKHPRTYAARLASGASPAAGRETITESQRRDETVLLRARLAEGLPLPLAPDASPQAIAGLISGGLIEGRPAIQDRLVILTLRGRLLADLVVRTLLGVNAPAPAPAG